MDPAAKTSTANHNLVRADEVESWGGEGGEEEAEEEEHGKYTSGKIIYARGNFRTTLSLNMCHNKSHVYALEQTHAITSELGRKI